MNLHDVNKGIHKNKRRLRIGRGPGSGRGKTSGRGHKGQGQLAGWSAHPVFEGARMPLVRRIPKRGFNNRWGAVVASINVGRLESEFAAGEDVTPDTLRDKGVVKGRYDFLKILGDGALTKKLKISAHMFSNSAREKITGSGSELIELPLPAPVVKLSKKDRDAKKDRAAK
jgi:large subunit ribosomal protein L15